MAAIKNDKFRVGASHTIGSYILPGKFISTISSHVDALLKLDIAPCREIVKAVKSRKVDFGLIEIEVEDDTLVSQDWIEDELVVFSQKELPSVLLKENLKSYKLVCGEIESADRTFIDTFLRKQDIRHYDFDSLVVLDNPTAVIQNIKWSDPNDPLTSIAIISKVAIEYELKYNHLYHASFYNVPMVKKLYFVYREDSAYREEIKVICKALLQDTATA